MDFKWLAIILGAAGLGIGLGIRALFPHFDMPVTDGSYGIGEISFEIDDQDRGETYTDDPGDYRRIMVTLWYPADIPKDAEYEGYPEEVADVFFNSLSRLPDNWFGYFSRADTHIVREAPPMEGSFPLVIFSPGNRSTRFQNMRMVEDLVSGGYIVAGIDHPYTSNDVAFPDGSVAFRPYDAEREQYTRTDIFTEEIEIRSADVSRTLDALSWEGGPWEEISAQTDFTKIGIVGHSYGGATAADALVQDSRILAGVSLDGGFWGRAADKGMAKPFIYLSASKVLDMGRTGEEDQKEFVRTVISNMARSHKNAGEDFYYLIMDGYDHNSFTDTPMILPFASGPKTAVDTVTDLTHTFLDIYIKGDGTLSLEDTVRQYDNIQFQQGKDITFPY